MKVFIDSELSDILKLLTFLKEIKTIMVTVNEIKSVTSDLLAKVNADDAVIATLAADVASIKVALDAAIVNGADPAVLQSISDDLASMNVSLDRQTVSEQDVITSTGV